MSGRDEGGSTDGNRRTEDDEDHVLLTYPNRDRTPRDSPGASRVPLLSPVDTREGEGRQCGTPSHRSKSVIFTFCGSLNLPLKSIYCLSKNHTYTGYVINSGIFNKIKTL